MQELKSLGGVEGFGPSGAAALAVAGRREECVQAPVRAPPSIPPSPLLCHADAAIGPGHPAEGAGSREGRSQWERRVRSCSEDYGVHGSTWRRLCGCRCRLLVPV